MSDVGDPVQPTVWRARKHFTVRVVTSIRDWRWPALWCLVAMLLGLSPNLRGQTQAESRCWEPDGPMEPTADHARVCPVHLDTLPPHSVGETGYTVAVATPLDTGTLLFLTSTEATPPARLLSSTAEGQTNRCMAQADAGVDCVTSLPVTRPGTYTLVVRDLVPDRKYFTHVQHQARGQLSAVITYPVRTHARASDSKAGREHTVLNGYFVGPGGCTRLGARQSVDGVNVICDGTSHQTRFAHAGLLAAVQPIIGADVWLAAGLVHNVPINGKLMTRWGGAPGDPAEWGCYYLAAGIPTACWEGPRGGQLDVHNRPRAVNTMGRWLPMPRILGALTDRCIANSNCNWLFPIRNECEHFSDALFAIVHGHVQVRGLRFGASTCRGMTINPPAGDGDDIRVWDSVFENIGYQFLVIQGGARYTVIKRNVFRGAGKCTYSRLVKGTVPRRNDPLAGNCGKPQGRGHSGGVVVSGVRDAYLGFLDNTVVATFSEGLQCFGSSKVWFKGNRVGNTAFAPYYLDTCEDAVVESNVAWSTNGDVGQPRGKRYGVDSASMRLIVEDSQLHRNGRHSVGVLVRNNLLAFNGTALKVALQRNAAAGGKQIGASYYHNTFVGALRQNIDVFQNLDHHNIAGVEIRNNLFAGPAGPVPSRCFVSADVTYDYNLYGFDGIPLACRGPNDINGGAATNPHLKINPFDSSRNEAAWRGHGASRMPDPDHARVVAGQATGARLNNLQCVDDAGIGGYARIAHEMDYPFSLDLNRDNVITEGELSGWKMCADRDFFGNPRGVAPSVGMHERGGPL